MKFLFVRHGETDFNRLKKVMGQRFDEPINERGVRQVQALLPRLKEKEIHVILSSPLRRARETARIIGKHLNLAIEVRDELTERDYGSLSGKTRDEVRETMGKSTDLDTLDREQRYDFRPYGGESVEEVKVRLLKSLEEIKGAHQDKVVLVVTHGGILRLLHQLFPQSKESPTLSNVSIHEFDL